MTFQEVLAQVIAWLAHDKRLSYRALQRQFGLDTAYLDDLKLELIEVKQLAVDQDGTMLVWTGDTTPASPPAVPVVSPQEREPLTYTPPHLAEKILTSRSALEGERKQVTVMFCDLANSTALAVRLGPERMHTLLNRFFALALDVVHRYEGTINQFLGDGFMALFGAPIAYEDHARRAVLAALELQRTLAEHHAELGAPYGVTCAFRLGLNTGLVVVGSIGNNLRMDYSAIGDTTNLAARLQQHAEPGTILVTEATRRLVEGAVHLEALPPVLMKGKAEPVTPYNVLGLRPQRSPLAGRGERALSQFVGRERELATLVEIFEQVERGQGQVVGIVAEAGGGKSRLLYEFRQSLAGKRVTYLDGRCLSYGHALPYHPIIDLLRTNCGITEADSPSAIANKVRLALHEVGLDVEASALYLLQLFGVQEGTERLAGFTSEAIKARTFETLRQMSLHGSQRRPLVCEIEDLHWCAHTSEDYLAGLVESITGAAVLLLVTHRPGYRPPWTEQGFPLWRAHSSMLRGWALAHQEQAKEGSEQLHQGLTALRATGAEVFRPYFLALLAEAYGTMGQPDVGLMALAEALTLVDATSERWYEPELHRLKGELLLQQSADHHATAQACFQHALDVARAQQARSLELRAATSLARLWQQQGKRAEAYQLLAEVYGWFTEGFDTADLQEAKALLDELAP